MITNYTVNYYKKIQSAKYLGIELSNDLKWSRHISQIASKANKTSAFISRNLKGCLITTQTHCFKTLVRPIVEYASSVWDPHLKKDINTLERIQSSAARRITNIFSLDTNGEEIAKHIGLETLSTCRKRSKATLIHKIHHKQIDAHLPDGITQINRRTRGHNYKMTIPPSKTNSHLYSFFPSAVRLWNTLPPEVVETENPKTLKKLLSDCISD